MANENDIVLSREQYNHDRQWWQEFVWNCANYSRRTATITVDNEVVYRAWPQRETVFKGYAEEQTWTPDT